MAGVQNSAGRAETYLRMDGISVSYGGHRVLTDVSVVAPAGTRTGLIGENGSGKSTLLRVAAGLIHPDVGTVSLTMAGDSTPRVGLLHQEPPFAPSDTVAETLNSAVRPVRQSLVELESASHAMANGSAESLEKASVNYQRALERAERLGAWNVDARIERTLFGLGINDLPRDRTTAALSGGQRSRLSLAWVLLSTPDLLLLDEPTNHLDDAATAHLRGVLASWAGPVLLASHDRSFLDETVTHLVDLDPSPLPHELTAALVGDGIGSGIGATRFTGTYSDYLSVRHDALARWARQYEQEQAEIKRLEATVKDSHVVGHEDWQPRSEVRMSRKYHADRNAKVVSRRVNDARWRLDDLRRNQIRRPPVQLRFQGLNVAASVRRPWKDDAGSVLQATNVAVVGRLAPTSITVGPGEKWLVTGANGVGKSTLLHVMAGSLEPDEGTVIRPTGLRVGLLAQENNLPDPYSRGQERSARQAYEDLVGARRAENVPLSTFGLLAPRDESRRVEVLSVGQQRRLELAVLLADPPDVLLLDEPTNHLSLLLVTELEAAIGSYPGAVVVASHDRWLRERWAGQHLELARHST